MPVIALSLSLYDCCSRVDLVRPCRPVIALSLSLYVCCSRVDLVRPCMPVIALSLSLSMTVVVGLIL